MNKYLLIFPQLMLVLLTVNCASLGPQFSKEENFNKNKSLVYIYRVGKFAGSAGSPYVCVDENVIGEIPNGGYFPFELSPGSHEIKLKSAFAETLASFNFKTQAGEYYFLRTDFSLNSGAQESTDRAREAALGPGGGGLLGSALSGTFFGSTDEANNILKRIDKRAQNQSTNPGFLFVTPKSAEEEIAKTKLFNVPEYKKNPCIPKKKSKSK